MRDSPQGFFAKLVDMELPRPTNELIAYLDNREPILNANGWYTAAPSGTYVRALPKKTHLGQSRQKAILSASRVQAREQATKAGDQDRRVKRKRVVRGSEDEDEPGAQM